MDESGQTRTDLGLFLDLAATDQTGPLYRRLFVALRQAILSSRIQGDSRLPSTRQLAGLLGISRNTVKGAYELLQAEGYLYSRRGAGCYVVPLPRLQEGVYQPPPPEGEGGAEPLRPAARSGASGLLQCALPALDHFPYRQWQRALQSALSRSGLLAADPQGDERLRGEIARWLGLQRGMRVDADQVLITSGSQQGLYLIARQLLRVDDRVLLETPGFRGTENAMRAVGARVIPFHQQALERIDRLPAAKLLLVTPSRNFPLGHSLAADRRLALLNWAQETGAWLVEDDYDSEFAVGAAQSALFALDRQQRVIYAGTFSRTLFPGLRLGYLVLPRPLVASFVAARQVMDGGLSTLPQGALAAFMASGDYSRHLRRMKRLYCQRRETLEQLLAQSALAELPIIDAGGGMHLCLRLPEDCDDQQLVRALNVRGVGARPLSAMGAASPGVILGFAADARPAMEEAIRRLTAVLGPAIAMARS